MGFVSNIIDGVKNISSTVGKVASALSGIPGIGGVASTVANVANAVNKGANFASDICNAVAPAVQDIAKGPGTTAEKVINAGKAIYNTADKMTDGAVSKGFKSYINQAKQRITVNAGQGGRLGSSGPTTSAIRGNSREGGRQFKSTTIKY